MALSIVGACLLNRNETLLIYFLLGISDEDVRSGSFSTEIARLAYAGPTHIKYINPTVRSGKVYLRHLPARFHPIKEESHGHRTAP